MSDIRVRRFGLIADTHGHLHPAVFELFAGVEAIFHAGDVVREAILDDLASIAPTFAVHGNCDRAGPRLPGLRVLDMPFGRLVLSHSHMLPAWEPYAIACHFASQQARVIVFGHTHKTCCERIGDVWVINPGPAGRPRLRDKPSVAVMGWDEGTDALTLEFIGLNWE